MKSVFDFDKNMTMQSAEQKNVLWRNVKDKAFGLYGSDALKEDGFCRLTKSERDSLRPINEGEAWLAEQSAGICVRFETNSAQIFVRTKLASAFDMTNMTQIGQCGADLYVYDEEFKEYVLHEVVRYPFHDAAYEIQLSHFLDAPKTMRRYILYLPLYMSVLEMEIGLDSGACVHPLPFASSKRIGIYGTSIVQGCSASRPGMASSNIVSRKLDAEVLNYGFSGEALMEPEMGEILGKHQMDILLVDSEPNAGVDDKLQKNAEGFLDRFLSAQPKTPVVLFSRVLFAMDRYDNYRIRLREYYQEFMKDLVEKYREKGYDMGFYDGSKIFQGNYTEYTADGIHPTDLGMIAIANAYEKKIREFLPKDF